MTAPGLVTSVRTALTAPDWRSEKNLGQLVKAAGELADWAEAELSERAELLADARTQALSEVADVVDTYKHKRDVLGLVQEPLDVVLGDWLDEEGSA